MINLGPYSGKNLPDIKPGYTLTQQIMDVVLILLLVIMWILTLVSYDAGRGISQFMWALSGTLITVIFLLPGRLRVKHYNFPVRVNEQNIYRQYKLATFVVKFMGIQINALFLAGLITNPTGERSGLTGIPLFFIILLAVTLLAYYVVARRLR